MMTNQLVTQVSVHCLDAVPANHFLTNAPFPTGSTLQFNNSYLLPTGIA